MGDIMATLSDKQAQLLLDKNFGSLATLRADGSPMVTPVWVDWDGQRVIVNTLRARDKPHQIARDPRVEIAVFSFENPYQHVRISGRAELSDEGAEEHIDPIELQEFLEDVGELPFSVPSPGGTYQQERAPGAKAPDQPGTGPRPRRIGACITPG